MTSRVKEEQNAFQLFLLSANTLQDIQVASRQLCDELTKHPSAYSGASVQVFRADATTAGWRGAVLFRDVADGCAALAPDSGRLLTAPVQTERARAAVLMFPGLGEHYVNMGLGLYRTEPVFRAAVDHCADILQRHLQLDLRSVLFAAPAEGQTAPTDAPRKLDLRLMLGRSAPPADAATQRLNRTELLQPILFVVEYALGQLLLDWGLKAEAMLGYSLGEYVSACLAGVLSLEDALALVAQRAQLIEQLPAGAMLAVTLPEPELLGLLTPELSLCAVNGNEYCVIGGPEAAVAAFERQLDERGVAARRVKTSHAFHSQMMVPIAGRLTELARSLSLQPPKIPYISNVTGAQITAEQATSASYFSSHLCSPVRCADGFRALYATSDRIFIEVGPGQSMCSLAVLQQGGSAQQGAVAIPLMRSAYEAQSDQEVLLTALGKLWLSGAALDWGRFASHSLNLQRADGAERPVSDSKAEPTISAKSAGSAAVDTAIAEQVAKIWSELFRGAKVTLDSSFRELGGNSLLATRLAQRLRKAFGIPIPLTRIFASPTVSQQAILIAGLLRPATSPSVAAEAPRSAEVPAARAPLTYPLPNGMTIFHQNEAETQHFYRDIFEHRAYLKGGLTIPDGATIFDVGANIGLFTLFASRQAQGVKIYSFEPAPPLFDILARNVERHHANAKLFNYGISNHERTATFTFYPSSSGMSSFYANLNEEKQVLRAIIQNQQKAAMPGMEQILPHAEELLDARFESHVFSCQIRPLSDIIREQGVTQIDLLKVDVQKAELEVLQGLADADWPKIRQIAIEVHDIAGRLAQMVALLEGHGYTVHYEQDELYQGTNLFNIYASRK